MSLFQTRSFVASYIEHFSSLVARSFPCLLLFPQLSELLLFKANRAKSVVLAEANCFHVFHYRLD